MIDVGVLQTLIVGHLWQSVAIAAVLAAVLILGRRLRGTTRYGLAATAFAASLVLPLAAFIPGDTLVTAVLDRLAPSVQVEEEAARNALDQDREVMAVPGNPLDARAGGCNQLIRDGATLVRDAADVAEALAASLGTPMPRAAPTAPPEMREPAAPDGPLKARLIELLGPAPVAEDLLIRDLAQPAGTVSALLLDLELAGRILRHPGGLVSLPAA
jgi:hypothetical protein